MRATLKPSALLPSSASSFFDWASTSPISVAAAAARQHFIALSAVAPDPPGFLRTETDGLGSLRDVLGRLVSASVGDGIVLGRSAAELLSLLASGLHLRGRHTVVLVEPNHPVAELAWLGAARRRDMRVISISADSRFQADLRQVRELVTSDCAAVCVTHVTHLHGGVQPIEELAAVAHHAGALLIVDGAQAVGRISVDLGKLGCDAYIGVGRKALLSPIGTAFLAADLELLSAIEPMIWSTRSAHSLDTRTSAAVAFPPPAGLEGNLPDISALKALEASVHAVMTVGMDEIQQHVQDVLPLVIDPFGKAGLLAQSPLPCFARNVGIMTFNLPRGLDGRALQSRLRASGHIVAADETTVRISLHIANQADHVEALVEEASRYATEFSY